MSPTDLGVSRRSLATFVKARLWHFFGIVFIGASLLPPNQQHKSIFVDGRVFHDFAETNGGPLSSVDAITSEYYETTSSPYSFSSNSASSSSRRLDSVEPGSIPAPKRPGRHQLKDIPPGRNVGDDETDNGSFQTNDTARYCPTSYQPCPYTYCGCKLVDANTQRLVEYNQGFKKEMKSRNNVSDPLYFLPQDMKRVPLVPQTQYLGVLLDAGRHYFPIPWIRNLLVLLNKLHFNLLHFRLTDDQAFNVLLRSQPNLTNAAHSSLGQVYSTEELEELSRFADTLNITIMPEINIPGHAASWAGKIPDIIVPCAEFICSAGYGLPLNLEHPMLYDIIRDVLTEVRSIFSSSPLIHLGGDEVNMAWPCFDETKKSMFDYNEFEKKLMAILDELSIPNANVLRWEMTGQQNVQYRVGGITQYWETKDYQGMEEPPRVFVSQGLYFDTNVEANGFEIFNNVKDIVDIEPMPVGVIAGAFELGTEFWMDRNVIGRLLAVQMGMSDRQYNTSGVFNAAYTDYCVNFLKLDTKLCKYKGKPTISQSLYHAQWSHMHSTWHQMLCERLTTSTAVAQVEAQFWTKLGIARMANKNFWDKFDEPHSFELGKSKAIQDEKVDKGQMNPVFQKLQKHQINHTGIIIDISRIENSPLQNNALASAFEFLSWLGFNTVQIRLMSDTGFGLNLEHLGSNSIPWGIDAHDDRAIKEHIVDQAHRLGIDIIPEISLATRAGGWFKLGSTLDCPLHICGVGAGIGVNVTDPMLLMAISSITHDMVELFKPPLVHFGFDEREEVQQCYQEAGATQDLDEFERRVKTLIALEDYSEDFFVRWQNKESKVYSQRAGKITQYQYTIPESPSSPFLITTGLDLDDTDNPLALDAFSAYNQARKLMAIEPTGVMAQVGLVHPRFWDDFAIKERLLGVAMALSGAKFATKEMFLEEFRKFLPAFNSTNAGGTIPDPSTAKHNLVTHLDIRLRQGCEERVSNSTKILPKQGVLTNIKSANAPSPPGLTEFVRTSIT